MSVPGPWTAIQFRIVAQAVLLQVVDSVNGQGGNRTAGAGCFAKNEYRRKKSELRSDLCGNPE
jgi:hypothetical protein